MKRAMLILFAMAFVVCTAVAEFSDVADSSEQKAFDGSWNEGKCCEDNYEHQSMCIEICPGSKPSNRCGCDQGNSNSWQNDWQGKKHYADGCYVFEKCKECGKARCDGYCNECKKRCDVYEYCPSCDVKYYVEAADGYCDRCGKDCYCIEKCQKCDHNHYYNGYCDECAGSCYYARCCHDSYEGLPHECHDEYKDGSPFGVKYPEKCEKCMTEGYADAGPEVFTIYLGEEGSDDAKSAVQEGYSDMEVINPETQDEYADQMPSNDSPSDEAQAS